MVKCDCGQAEHNWPGHYPSCATVREWKDKPCPVCGEPVTWRADKSFTQGQRQIDTGECNSCATWTVLLAHKPPEVVIDGVWYSIGTGAGPDKFCGMGGRRFDIEFFDGRIVTTHDLWYQGPVPPNFRGRVPDTARFAGGAHTVTNGEGGLSWQSSAAGVST